MKRLIQLNEYGQGLPGISDFFSRDDEEERNARRERAIKQLRAVMQNELTARQREMICLYYFDKLNTVEIASKLGINKSSVSRTLSRARERIRRSMRYGFERL